MTTAFAALLDDDGMAASRVALVVSSALTGFQVKRVSGSYKTRVIDNVEAASAWLEADAG